jgi:hypothetical protein
MPSRELLQALPTVERTYALTRSLAVLDAILSPDWEYRYYSFDPSWGDDEAVASMRNGSGDDWFCWFGPPGAAILGFDHESSMSPYALAPRRLWPGLTKGLPDAFVAAVLHEAAFSPDDTTFLVWRERTDHTWRSGAVQLPGSPDPDGAEWLLELVWQDDPQAYVDFAAEYYELQIGVAPVTAVWRSDPLTAQIVRALNPQVTLADVRPDVAATGYPVVDA